MKEKRKLGRPRSAELTGVQQRLAEARKLVRDLEQELEIEKQTMAHARRREKLEKRTTYAVDVSDFFLFCLMCSRHPKCALFLRVAFVTRVIRCVCHCKCEYLWLILD